MKYNNKRAFAGEGISLLFKLIETVQWSWLATYHKGLVKNIVETFPTLAP